MQAPERADVEDESLDGAKGRVRCLGQCKSAVLVVNIGPQW